ncbi:hypothetical protein L596_026862 [Steinernema carpocapsae]|uniref:Uncharacterized protein n=1 Tax=Steinernema carpocapsae TaxID=34508 RepID=A0A4U5M2K9_STECR|nr:hypothetical protein L596_026862 [Steinernema carpocapsae]
MLLDISPQANAHKRRFTGILFQASIIARSKLGKMLGLRFWAFFSTSYQRFLIVFKSFNRVFKSVFHGAIELIFFDPRENSSGSDAVRIGRLKAFS